MKKKSDSLPPDRLHSLLVPIDLSPVSERVLGRLSLLPLADDARLTLLHVIPGGLVPRERQKAERHAEKALAADAQHLRKSLREKVNVETLLRFGGAPREISDCARELTAQLIVMGRGGGRPLRDVFLGSTAERVVRQARLPVLVVRLPPRTPYARPALALDLDPAANEVVRVLLQLLQRPRPGVAVVHAFDVPYRGAWYPTLPEHEMAARTAALHLEATQKLGQLLATSLAKAKVPQTDAPFWRTHVQYGSARLLVEKFIKKAETDLLALGTHAYSGAAHALLGTVAGDLLRAATCDVLVVPPVRSVT